MESLVTRIRDAIKNSPNGITTLDILEGLSICDSLTLKTTLSRLGKAGKIIRLKRGVYSTTPLTDAFAAAQSTFEGYIGFSSALYLHKLITESPFVITVVTKYKSSIKRFGSYEFRAVALKEKAIGFEELNSGIVVSTKAKTLFDCLYLERYSVEMNKLVDAYKMAQLTAKESREFDFYVEKFVPVGRRKRFEDSKRLVIGKV